MTQAGQPPLNEAEIWTPEGEGKGEKSCKAYRTADAGTKISGNALVNKFLVKFLQCAGEFDSKGDGEN